MLSKFDSVDSIVNYLREPTGSSTVVDPTITASRIIRAKKQQKEKEIQNIPASVAGRWGRSNLAERYGPVTVNPRKQPSKTLYTGRRSKYEVLLGEEEEKRRDRRERNRVAATKCREKRENVLSNLENEHETEVNKHAQLLALVNELEQRKLDLETIMTNHLNECLLMNNSSGMIFGDTGFLSSITDAPPLPLPSYQQTNLTNEEEEEFSLLLESPISPYSPIQLFTTDESTSILLPLPMTNSSIDRLVNALQSPTVSMESANNHSMLFNSAVGSSCAKQHSSSSEDDSLPPKHSNPYVC